MIRKLIKKGRLELFFLDISCSVLQIYTIYLQIKNNKMIKMGKYSFFILIQTRKISVCPS